MTLNSLTRRQYKHLCWPYLFWFLALFLSSGSYALECPRIPEQARNDLEVEVRSAVGKIGTAKGAELESRTRSITQDLLGKLPKADKVYLELMMYAAYCSTLRDDSALTEAQKSARIRAYNLELKRTLEGAEGSGGKHRTDPRDLARAELERLPLPYTTDAFVESAEDGNLAVVKLFLAAGVDPNGKNKYGISALMAAAAAGHTEIVKVLLKAKANVNQRNPAGNTAVFWAMWGGHKDVLRLLLDHRVDADAIQVPFEVAAEKGDAEALRMLFKHGIDDNTLNKALIAAVKGDLFTSEADLNEAVRLLLEQGADVNAKVDGCTALAVAAAWERASIVKTLLDAGGDINSTCDDGSTALMRMIRIQK